MLDSVPLSFSAVGSTLSEEKYLVHSDPVWRSRANYIGMVDLSPFGFEGLQEQLWFRSLPEGGFETCCIPFRTYGLTLADIVDVDSDRGRVIGIRERRGHRALRVFFPPDVSGSDLQHLRGRTIQAISAEGLLAEWSGTRHVAIDVPPGGEVHQVALELQVHVEAKRAYWEWGDVEPFRL